MTVVGDSQTKHIHQYFDPALADTPAFVSQCGALITDVPALLDFVPRNTTRIVLHVGTNDLLRVSAQKAFDSYCKVINHIAKERPEVTLIYATLILPRTRNRRRWHPSETFVRCFNREACYFNALLKNLCRRSRLVSFLDHGFEWLPSHRVLAADGLHPNFEGVSLMASHIRHICYKPSSARSHSWLDSVPTDPPQHHARRPTVVRESSDTALVTGQTRSCASPQKPPSPHERVTQDYRNKVSSKSCPTDSATRGSSIGPSHSAKDPPDPSASGHRYKLRSHTQTVRQGPAD